MSDPTALMPHHGPKNIGLITLPYIRNTFTWSDSEIIFLHYIHNFAYIYCEQLVIFHVFLYKCKLKKEIPAYSNKYYLLLWTAHSFLFG